MMEAMSPMGVPGMTQPGQGGDHSYSAVRTAGAFDGSYFKSQAMTKDQKVEALTHDVRTEVNEFFRDTKIEKIAFTTGKKEVTDPQTGQKNVMDTVYFKQYAGRSLPDVTNAQEEGGKVRSRIIERSKKIAQTDGVIAWVSPGEEDRFYIAEHDGNGDGSLYSVKLQHRDENSLWNLMDTLSGEQHDRKNSSLKDITIVRDRNRGEKPLDVSELVHTYTHSLSPTEMRTLSPFVNSLIKEAAVSEEVRDGDIRKQEAFVKKQVEQLLEDRQTQVALGLVGQSLGAWARVMDEDLAQSIPRQNPNRETVIQNPDGIERLSTQPKPGDIFGRSEKTAQQSHRRHRGHSGGRGYRRWRRKEEVKLTGGIKILPTKERFSVEKEGEKLVAIQKKRVLVQNFPQVYEKSGYVFQSKTSNQEKTDIPQSIKRQQNQEQYSPVIMTNDQIGSPRKTLLQKEVSKKGVVIIDKQRISSVEKSIRTSFESDRLNARHIPNEKKKKSFIQKESGKNLRKSKDKMELSGNIKTSKKKDIFQHFSERIQKVFKTRKEQSKKKKIEIFKALSLGVTKRSYEKILKSARFVRRLEKRLLKDNFAVMTLKEKKQLLRIAKKLWGNESQHYKKLLRLDVDQKAVQMLRKDLLEQLRRRLKRKRSQKSNPNETASFVFQKMKKPKRLKERRMLKRRKNGKLIFQRRVLDIKNTSPNGVNGNSSDEDYDGHGNSRKKKKHSIVPANAQPFTIEVLQSKGFYQTIPKTKQHALLRRGSKQRGLIYWYKHALSPHIQIT